MTITREDIAREARALKGTPFHHQGRLPGVGIDCIGTILVPAHRLGLTDFDFSGYGRQPDPAVMWGVLKTLERSGLIRRIPKEAAIPWDLVVMRADDDPTHFAWLTEIGILHTRLRRDNQESKCVEHRLSASLRDKVVAAYRICALDNEGGNEDELHP